jgi:hypothetical protein
MKVIGIQNFNRNNYGMIIENQGHWFLNIKNGFLNLN